MATTTWVTIETYLQAVSDPDCEYVDGEIVERPAAEYDQSSWQSGIMAFFPNSLAGVERPFAAGVAGQGRGNPFPCSGRERSLPGDPSRADSRDSAPGGL